MMTPRQRWLAAVQMQPVDRLPFWPKLDNAYPRAQDAPFRQMPAGAIQDWIGSDKHVGIPGFLKTVWKNGALQATQQNGVRKTVYQTRPQPLELVDRFDEASQSWHPIKHPVKTLEDVRALTEFFSEASVEVDHAALERARQAAKQVGEEAVTHSGAGTSALMDWVQRLAGPENCHLLLADYPEEVAALFEAMHRLLRRKVELLCELGPSDLIYMTENTSTTLISPRQYRQHCYPHIKEYAQIATDGGRLMVLHMCGLLKRLLPDLATVAARAFEAFTSPPVGDTSFLDGRSVCPDKCLIGGTNAVLWTKSADEIIAQIEADLDALPHHRGLVVTSAGVMPPMAKPETIKRVGQWVRSYKARM